MARPPNRRPRDTNPALDERDRRLHDREGGGAGFALSALNPKNVLLVVAAALEIVALGLPASDEITALLVFVVIASIGVLTPVVLAAVLGDRSRAPLDTLRGWMARNNATVMAVLFLVIGAKLVGDAVAAFFR